jgi:ribosomal-protein-alanine N-acetyltransferase
VPKGLRIPARSVRLRDFSPGDIDDAETIVGDDRVTAWLSFDSRDRVGTERMITAAISEAEADPRTEYYLAVAHPDSDRVIGFVRLALGGVRAAKLGYAIHADHWGRGHATDAARAIIDFGFQALELHRITAAVGPDNHASQAVLKRLGFIHEGRLREHVFTNGAWRDSLLYSLLGNEWSERR